MADEIMIMTAVQKRKMPCKGCGERYPGCSDHCRKEDFLAWRAEQEKIRKNRRKYVSSAWLFREQNDRRRGMK